MRPGEVWRLKWIDINFENSTIRITPEKGSNPRILNLSDKLLSMINRLPRKNIYLFNSGLLEHFAQNISKQRKTIAYKLNNPRIEQINFKTFRQFKETMEYYKNRDILPVKYVLGHKLIENTLVYTHLINFGSDEFVSKVARNAEEACKLVEAGFEFVCNTPDSLMVFRMRK